MDDLLSRLDAFGRSRRRALEDKTDEIILGLVTAPDARGDVVDAAALSAS
ncbi:MAG: hypothetical protein H0W23_00080 [Chloroflexia bacterium]|nr:hypothetical protein [Chloroflexia bacterium]